jgi:hypothetical protein
VQCRKGILHPSVQYVEAATLKLQQYKREENATPLSIRVPKRSAKASNILIYCYETGE